jgi:hypothetical protein
MKSTGAFARRSSFTPPEYAAPASEYLSGHEPKEHGPQFWRRYNRDRKPRSSVWAPSTARR